MSVLANYASRRHPAKIGGRYGAKSLTNAGVAVIRRVGHVVQD
jgi:hypothetical protein